MLPWANLEALLRHIKLAGWLFTDSAAFNFEMQWLRGVP
jgi:hypothetical protein